MSSYLSSPLCEYPLITNVCCGGRPMPCSRPAGISAVSFHRQLENTSSPKYLFFQRQFWSCVKFVGNLTSWDGLLSPDILQQLVLDSVLNRYLLLSLQNSPPSLLSLTKAQAVSLPSALSFLPHLFLSPSPRSSSNCPRCGSMMEQLSRDP